MGPHKNGLFPDFSGFFFEGEGFISEPSRHGPDCPPVVVKVGDRTVRTALLLSPVFVYCEAGKKGPFLPYISAKESVAQKSKLMA